MTRVAWITPGYPPDPGGVSDHSFEMVSALQAQCHDTRVYSNPHQTGFQQLDGELARYRPDVVVVAYVPLGFAPRTGGISLAFVLWSMQLGRRTGARTVLLAHEAAMPALAHWKRRELKLAALAAAQGAQFEILARCYESVVFSHEGNRHIWAKRMPKLRNRLRTMRICSTIPVLAASDPRATLTAAGYSVPARTVLFFGSGHESVQFDFIEAALMELTTVDPEVGLVIVGIDQAKLRRLRPSLADLGPRVQALGFLPPDVVSCWLQVTELVLGPFIEGVNARKTTAMAAFQHGRALVTTEGIHTRSDIPWAQLCALAPVEQTAFAATAVRCFRDATWRAQLGAAARSDYEANASAPVTAARLLEDALGERA